MIPTACRAVLTTPFALSRMIQPLSRRSELIQNGVMSSSTMKLRTLGGNLAVK